MLQQGDKHEFINATMKEISGHENRDYWSILRRDQMPVNKKYIFTI